MVRDIMIIMAIIMLAVTKIMTIMTTRTKPMTITMMMVLKSMMEVLILTMTRCSFFFLTKPRDRGKSPVCACTVYLYLCRVNGIFLRVSASDAVVLPPVVSSWAVAVPTFEQAWSTSAPPAQ